MNELNVKTSTLSRPELELPRLHFIAMDNWINVIGDRALMAWLRFYTWCDRSDGNSEVNKWEKAKLPFSINKTIERLGVGRDTFFSKILKPLWNVGLIDVEEYEASQNLGQKPANIIVYKYPQNNIDLQSKPLEEFRNYDKDYSSTARTFAKQGGRPKSVDKGNDTPGLDENQPPSQIEPPPSQNGTGSCSEIEPNNSFNTSFNSPNILNNTANDLNNSSKSSSSNGSELILEDEEYNVLIDFLKRKGFTENIAKNTVSLVKGKGITNFKMDDLVNAFEKMERHNKLDPVQHPHTFFANGLESAIASSAMGRSYEDRLQRRQEEANQPKQIIYNWLEEEQ